MLIYRTFFLSILLYNLAMTKSRILETDRPSHKKERTIINRIALGLEGIQVTWEEEKGFRNQVFGFGMMIATLLFINPPLIWWCLAIVSYLFVLSLELINAAIESFIDFLHPNTHPAIKKIKDITGAAVILSSLGLLILGLALIFNFWPL
jgi:undecaprenol kinase